MSSSGVEGPVNPRGIVPATVDDKSVFDGMDTDSQTLNSKGTFVSRSVRKLESFTSVLRGEGPLQEKQDKGQIELTKRRAEVLREIKPAVIARQLDSATVDSKGITLASVDCPELNDSIDNIFDLTKDDLVGARVDSRDVVSADSSKANGSKTRVVVAKEEYTERVRKDLSDFFRAAVKSSATPHALTTLHRKIELAQDDGKLSSTHAHSLKKTISEQYKKILGKLPEQLKNIERASTSSGDAETQKLKYIHELVHGLADSDPKLLKSHSRSLGRLATQAYTDSTLFLEPDGEDLSVTAGRLKQSREDMDSLLEPVFKKTSPDSVKDQLRTVTSNVRQAHRRLEKQLEAIPNLRKDLDKQEKIRLDHLRTRSSKAASLRELEEKIAGVTKNLSDRKDRSHRFKFLRRISPGYQLDRYTLRKQKFKYIKEARELTRDISDLSQRMKEAKIIHKTLEKKLNELTRTFCGPEKRESESAIVDKEKVLNIARDTSPVEEELSSLVSGQTLTGSDLAMTRQYFDSVSKTGLSPQVVKRQAREFSRLVSEEKRDCQEALHIIDLGLRIFKDHEATPEEAMSEVKGHKHLFLEHDSQTHRSATRKTSSTSSSPKSAAIQERSRPELIESSQSDIDSESVSEEEMQEDFEDSFDDLSIEEWVDTILDTGKKRNISDTELEEFESSFDPSWMVSKDLEFELTELLRFFNVNLENEENTFQQVLDSFKAGYQTLKVVQGGTEYWDTAVEHLSRARGIEVQ